MTRNPHHLDYVTCSAHGKRAYSNKREAKRAIKKYHPGEHLDAYECSALPGTWHIGHLPSQVQRGRMSRRAVATKRGYYR